MAARPPLLVLGVGNPSRGDDALGPLFIERLTELLASELGSGAVELLTDFQLQIEHALDVAGRSRVVFVDASVSVAPPFAFRQIAARRDGSHTTHSLSPEAVLDAHGRIAGTPPEAWVLAIRGERFELGEPLTARAEAHLHAALTFFLAEVRGPQSTGCGRRIELEGTVQGVGLRPWLYRLALRLGLRGEAFNTPAGVCIDAFGSDAELAELLAALQGAAPAAARVRSVRLTPIAERGLTSFDITPSRAQRSPGAGSPSLALPPDLATCEDCSREVANPCDRHHGYVFTSCTACGPRLAIARSLPYDRATTALADFTPCAACSAEYSAPEDRRFHAQTLACAACGPRMWLADPLGREQPCADPIDLAGSLLASGKILGVQGLGAFHLVCDALDGRAVAELRRRKRREQQPFAVMVPDLAAARRIAALDPAAEAALSSPARPIVLAPERAGVLAPEVNGPSRRSGVMLPYQPLHARLLARAGRPLVVTSGNPSGGPALIAHDEACHWLGPSVDGFLFHNRGIERRVEDSVVAATGGSTRVVRRSRGFAPQAIRLPAPAREPVLAVGGHLKNTACLVLGDLAYLTPHLGDLGLEESRTAWQRDVEGFERLLGAQAQVLAHDLHPDYASTRYAQERSARLRIGVQHHVAHVLAAVAELQVAEPVLGVAFDGSGWGPDATAWGAELLIVDGSRWQRASTFRALPLPGGERALREVWRAAFAALCDAFGSEEALALAPRLRALEGRGHLLPSVARLIDTNVSTVPARGMGRWFDAVGALVLGLPVASFEGHVAVALEEAAGSLAAEPYPLELPSALATAGPLSTVHEVDPRPLIRSVLRDVLDGVPPARIAARFHRSIVDATAAVTVQLLAETGLRRVVLTGGSFQNRLLEQGILERLGPVVVSMEREVPINDGGLALGQAWAAVLELAAAGE